MSKSNEPRLVFTFLFAILIGITMMFYSCNRNLLQMQNIEKGIFLKEVYHSDSGNLNYRMFYPKHFDPSEKHPLLLFMHGAGERGDDNEAQLTHGADLIAEGMNRYNAIAIVPQCPEDDYWVKFVQEEVESDGVRSFIVDVDGGPSIALDQVIELVSEIKSKKYIDQTRIYVSGLSMGGMATFDLLWRMPNTFAAAMPICGAGSPNKASFMKSIPMRIFHGEEDSVVPIEKSKEMEKAILMEGGNLQTFYYPGVNHDSWTKAFAEKDFLAWMFDQKRVAY